MSMHSYMLIARRTRARSAEGFYPNVEVKLTFVLSYCIISVWPTTVNNDYLYYHYRVVVTVISKNRLAIISLLKT